MDQVNKPLYKMDIIQYHPFSSVVDPGFWHKLTQIKLDIDKLEEKRKSIFGSFSYQANTTSLFEVGSAAFNSSPEIQKFRGISHGVLLNRNTLEDFKDCDKTELLNKEGAALWEDIQGGACIEKPSLLSRFFILSFADLKKYQYLYWFAFPAPSHPLVYISDAPTLMTEKFTQLQLSQLNETYAKLKTEQKQYFSLENKNGILKCVPLSEVICKGTQQDLQPGVSADGLCFGFLDSSNNEYPGWSLRNMIAMLAYHCKSLRGKVVPFVALRLKSNGGFNDSLVYNVFIPSELDGEWGKNWVGWERNDKGKLTPRSVNMASSMDPIKLAESSVDLNLKLTKWRLLPDLNLEILRETKCLLLGSGTLGCSVARNLLAWGVRDITFLDNGRVSYSNPVRQNLFTHEDCFNGGKQKARAAADNLRKIFPGVNSYGVDLHIPMPGHPVGNSLRQQTIQDIERLTELISSHHIIFLLLDSREARWLPTLLAAHFGKTVLNAALGFDSYLVMRHGIADDGEESSSSSVPEDGIKRHFIPGHKLGCYYCSDVTAPGNSQKDRTLDQQCTVTRPGVSAVAAALAVEMAVALTQHKLRLNAPAPYNFAGHPDTDECEGILGPIPHSIRGFLSSYQQVLPSSGKFKQCIACSPIVIDLYRTRQIDFLMQVFGSAKYLEDVTGLTNLHLEANNAEILALSDSDTEF